MKPRWYMRRKQLEALAAIQGNPLPQEDSEVSMSRVLVGGAAIVLVSLILAFALVDYSNNQTQAPECASQETLLYVDVSDNDFSVACVDEETLYRRIVEVALEGVE